MTPEDDQLPSPASMWDAFKGGAQDWYAGGIDKLINGTDAQPFNNFANTNAAIARGQIRDSSPDQITAQGIEAQGISDAVPRGGDPQMSAPVPAGNMSGFHTALHGFRNALKGLQ